MRCPVRGFKLAGCKRSLQASAGTGSAGGPPAFPSTRNRPPGAVGAGAPGPRNLGATPATRRTARLPGFRFRRTEVDSSIWRPSNHEVTQPGRWRAAKFADVGVVGLPGVRRPLAGPRVRRAAGRARSSAGPKGIPGWEPGPGAGRARPRRAVGGGSCRQDGEPAVATCRDQGGRPAPVDDPHPTSTKRPGDLNHADRATSWRCLVRAAGPPGRWGSANRGEARSAGGHNGGGRTRPPASPPRCSTSRSRHSGPAGAFERPGLPKAGGAALTKRARTTSKAT